MLRNGKPDQAARYAMVIDLDRCTGCGACVVACAVENNLPPSAPNVNERTAVAWLRIERVEVNGRVAFVPIMCQQCDHETPCAAVCPQNAVELDPATGVVGQIAQRCLGCRYCMAACPYHARVFNWHDPAWPKGIETMLNPAVAPRMRGVVEKCSFCAGRWHAAKEKAAAAGKREIDMADYVPACVEACGANAITFGDAKQPQSAVAKAAATPGAFRILEPLHTGSKVYYTTAQTPLRKALKEERS
ncbi:MAG: 4Fe-4S dicluster domain-containing protein [Bryobacterales bacterium]|nr:4Fe-4S dicluster domain-containing protein [Bryobacterales bacterium]